MIGLLRYRLDPVALFEDVVGKPYPWQVDALRSNSKRQLYLCTRKAGKSSVAAVKALYVTLFNPGSLVLIVSRSQDQSQEIFRICERAYREIGKPFGTVAQSTQRLEMQNGSRVVCISGQEDAGRSYTAHMLIIDEAARVSEGALEGALGTIVDGTIIALTTPKGPRGWFHDLWTRPDVDTVWERYQITAEEIPNPALHDKVEEERFWKGERHVRQEYYCSFEADESGFFEDHAVLERSLVVPDDEPVWFPERNP